MDLEESFQDKENLDFAFKICCRLDHYIYRWKEEAKLADPWVKEVIVEHLIGMNEYLKLQEFRMIKRQGEDNGTG